MAGCGCAGERSGRVWFRYGSDQPWDNVVSRRPPICWECVRAQGGQIACSVYHVQVDLVVARPPYDVCPYRYTTETYSEVVYGPVGAVRLTDPGLACGSTHFGRVGITCRGRWDGGRQSCNSTTVEIQSAVASWRVNREISAVRILNLDGSPSNGSGNTFRVWDQSGTLYTRTEATCPQVRITCDEECPPGTEPFCGCCCPCEPMLQEARSIQSLLRSL